MSWEAWHTLTEGPIWGTAINALRAWLHGTPQDQSIDLQNWLTKDRNPRPEHAALILFLLKWSSVKLVKGNPETIPSISESSSGSQSLAGQHGIMSKTLFAKFANFCAMQEESALEEEIVGQCILSQWAVSWNSCQCLDYLHPAKPFPGFGYQSPICCLDSTASAS